MRKIRGFVSKNNTRNYPFTEKQKWDKKPQAMESGTKSCNIRAA